MDREAVDKFLAEADDVIADWRPGVDAAGWAADGSHEVATRGNYYGQDHDGGVMEGLIADYVAEAYARALAVAARLSEQSQLCAECRADMRRRWPATDARGVPEHAWPGTCHPDLEHLPLDRLWALAERQSFPIRWAGAQPAAWAGPTVEPTTPIDLLVFRVKMMRARWGEGDPWLEWPVLVENGGRCIGPVWPRQVREPMRMR